MVILKNLARFSYSVVVTLINVEAKKSLMLGISFLGCIERERKVEAECTCSASPKRLDMLG